ncbi:hypothetical protein CDV31_004570 [Fusarium ambrosium]|uniref:AMP-dependent synthetase/ligase domain-containing protein n=1 Tax=Fusarium ambrosium TaxID=131363 RepID=A0A428UPI6_9HYPO|nr:hypothetical protein CDV31_004570 [Fusarium ambrosium]
MDVCQYGDTLGCRNNHLRFCQDDSEIDEASTTIANYLHDSGITNGDFVMIFAHRSVELASGATVTVLDPLYPPQRQQIYLEVSQPKALISIGKTTDENGPLAPLVQKYIDEDLGINVWIPELRLSDAGLLSGGAKEGMDIFHSLRSKFSSPPDVIVGPDSYHTLSITSRCERRPKGALGRHYGVTRHFPWMSKRFNLSSESFFACLSGIAHDPIQRDIMTPLFLGAQVAYPG